MVEALETVVVGGLLPDLEVEHLERSIELHLLLILENLRELPSLAEVPTECVDVDNEILVLGTIGGPIEVYLARHSLVLEHIYRKKVSQKRFK